jgi:hypothetical protein
MCRDRKVKALMGTVVVYGTWNADYICGGAKDWIGTKLLWRINVGNATGRAVFTLNRQESLTSSRKRHCISI